MFLLNGDVSLVTHVGTSSLFNKDTITNIFHLPQFKYNLIAVSKLTKELNWMVAFFSEFCVFQDLLSGKVKGVGREKDGLYLFVTGANEHTKLAGLNVQDSDCRINSNEVDI